MAGQALAVEQPMLLQWNMKSRRRSSITFTQFIDWPLKSFEAEDSPLRIGILGTGPIDNPLMNLNGKKVQKRSLEVSKVRRFK